MNFKLNLITGKAGDAAFTPVDIEEVNFWKFYLELLGVMHEKAKTLNKREIEVFSFILSLNPSLSYFRGDGAKIVKERYGLSAPSLSGLKDSLIKKGYVEETGIVRGDALPKGNLRKFQIYVKDKGLSNISFVFAFKILNDEEA